MSTAASLRHPRPLVSLLFGLLLLTLGFALHNSYQSALQESQDRVRHYARLLAEHAARSLEATDILLREIVSDLHNSPDWPHWSADRGYNYVSTRHIRTQPQLRDLIIFDGKGNQRFISTYFPPPQINVEDRPYFQNLLAGQNFTTYGPYVGRNSQRYTYALARRIQGRDGQMQGAAFAALEPEYFQRFCWANRLHAEMEGYLLNRKGEVVMACRPTDFGRGATIIGKPLSQALPGLSLPDDAPDEFNGQQGNWLYTSITLQPYQDLRMLILLPRSVALAPWQQRLLELGLLTLLLAAALALLLRHQRRQLQEIGQRNHQLQARQQELEQQIHQAQGALAQQHHDDQRTAAAKGRFLSAASHDLRQPLHALTLFAADLARHIRNGDTQPLSRLAEQIKHSIELLGRLLDSLLDISRLDVAGVTPNPQSFPLADLFNRLNHNFRNAAASKGLRLRFRAGKHWVHSDPLLLERILNNLLNNALRFTEHGSLLVLARRRQGQIRIEVRDSGIGIREEHLPDLFKEFFQVNNVAREAEKGLGLGLPIVERLARALNTRVQVCSRPGQGSTFALSLPTGQPGSCHPTQARSACPHTLCVGTDPLCLEARSQLEKWNYPCTTIANWSELAQQGNQPILALLTDPHTWSQRPETLPRLGPILILGGTSAEPRTDANLYHLNVPIRPAKLRALLSRIEQELKQARQTAA